MQPGTTLGDIAYSSATANTNTRLGIGTTSQVLTVTGGVPAWATPSAGSMVLITTNSYTASSGVSIDNCFSATYENYIVEIVGSASSSSTQIKLRYRKSAADLTASLYDLRGSTVVSAASSYGLTQSAASKFAATLTFFDVFSSGRQVVALQAVGLSTGVSGDGQAGVGWYDVATSGADGFTLFPSTGTITGTVRIYGLVNS